MTKSEYMKKLSYSLRRLPKEDFNQAIDYFEEYFAEAGEENEQQAIEDLGSPEDAAKELITSDRTFFDLCDRSRDCFCFLCVCRLVSYGGYAGGSCGDRRDRRSGSADPKSPGWIGDIRIQSLLRRSRNCICIWNFLLLKMAAL